MMQDILIETKIYPNYMERVGRSNGNVLKAQLKERSEKTRVTTALYDVSLQIPRGKIFVIIGLSLESQHW